MNPRGRPPTGTPVLVRIPPAVLALLDAEAERDCITRAALIRNILTDYFAGCQNTGTLTT